MAKALLLSWLVDTLGPYVDNLTTDNLRMGVLDGVLEFHNLHLKPLALAKLNLPFIVHKFARIKFLRIVIPWTNLGGGIPVQLVVDGVYVQIDPLDYSELDKEEIETRTNELRKEILRQATSLAMETGLKRLFQSQAATGDSDQSSDAALGSSKRRVPSSSSAATTAASVRSSNTYTHRLFAKVLANIEVSIRNVHFRYEDSRTLVGQAISAGFTLDELLIVSTDDNWNEMTLERSAPVSNSTSTKVPKFKIASLRNLTAYWNTDATAMNSQGSTTGEAWEQAMAGLVYKAAIGDVQGGNSREREDMRYVLSAPNTLAVKLCDRSTVKAPSKQSLLNGEPVLDIVADTSGRELQLALDSTQLLQICLVVDNFAATERSKFLKLFRPTDRPTKDPRAWWIYAYRLVTGRDDVIFTGRLSTNTVKTCVGSRSRYMALAKKSFDKSTDAQHAAFLASMAELNVPLYAADTNKATLSEQFMHMTQSTGTSSLTTSEQAELLRLEGLVPLPALVVYRQLAVRELVEIAKTKRDTLAEKVTKKREKEILEGAKPVKLVTKMKNFFRYGSFTASSTSPIESFGGGDEKKKKGMFQKLFLGGKSKKGMPPVDPTTGLGPPVGVQDNDDDEDDESSGSGKVPSMGSTSLETDVSMDVLRENFGEKLWGEAEAEVQEGQGTDTLLVRAHCSLGLRVLLTVESRPLLDAALRIELQLGSRSTSDLSLRFAVHDLYVRDRVTPAPIRPYLLSYISQPNCGQRGLSSKVETIPGGLVGSEKLVIDLEVSHDSGKASLRISALPVELAWNGNCITSITDMFASPLSVLSPWPRVPMASHHLLSHWPADADAASGSEGAANGPLKLFISVDMEAPKIIIPADSSVDGVGFVVLDMGSLSFRASLDPAISLFSWKISLSDFCARIPSSSSEIYAESQPTDMYLISPLRVQAYDGQASGLTPQDHADYIVLIEPQPRMHVRFNSATLSIFVDVINRLVTDIELMQSICKKADSRKARRESEFVFDELGTGTLADTTSDPLEQSKQAVTIKYLELLDGHALVKQLQSEVEVAVQDLFKRKEDLNKPNAIIKITLSELLCEVLYKGQWDASAEAQAQTVRPRTAPMLSIILPAISVDIAIRPKDLIVDISVGQIVLKDSLRPRIQEFLLQSTGDDEDGKSGPAATVHIREIRGVSSPLFAGQGLEVTLAVKHVDAFLDANAILHAHSVAQVLVDRINKALAQRRRQNVLAPQNSASFMAQRKFADGERRVRSISADILHSPSTVTGIPGVSSGRGTPNMLAPIPDDEETDFAESDEVGSRNILETLARSVSFAPSSALGQSPIHRRSSYAEVDLRRRGSIVVGMARRQHMRTILPGKLRQQRAELEFKLLRMTVVGLSVNVFKATEGQEEGPDSPLMDPVCQLQLDSVTGLMKNRRFTSSQLAVSAMGMTDERRIASNFTFRQMMDCRSDPGGGPDGSDLPCLYVGYSEEADHRHTIDIVLRNLMSTYALDSLVDTSNVGINLAFAVLTIITPPDAEEVFVATPLYPTSGVQDSVRRENDENAEDDDEGLSDFSSDDYGTDIIVEDISGVEGSAPLHLAEAPPPHAKAWTVHLKLPNPHVVLIDDPLVEFSRSLVGTCVISVKFSIDSWGTVLHEKQEALQGTAQNVEIYAIPDTKTYLSQRASGIDEDVAAYRQRCVCEKFNVDFHATRKLEQDVVLAANITLRVSDINAVLSLENIHLLDSVLSRRVLTGLPASRQIRNTRYCIFGARDGKAGTQVDIYVFVLNAGTITITAINDLDPDLLAQSKRSSENAKKDGIDKHGDFLGYKNYPALMRVQFSGASFHGDGAMHPRLLVDNTAVKLEIDVHHVQSSGFLVASLDFFNSHVQVWEPVVELWRPELLVKKGHQGMNIEVSASRTLQFNISGRMIDSIMKAYSLLLQRSEDFLRSDHNASKDNGSGTALPSLNQGGNTQMPKGATDSGFQGFLGPGIVVFNRLLCDIEYRVVLAKTAAKISAGIPPGFAICLREAVIGPGLLDSVQLDPRVTGATIEFRSPGYLWSKPLPITDKDKEVLLSTEMVAEDPTSYPLVLRLQTTPSVASDISRGPVIELAVFINAALIDRTGLQLSVRTSRKFGSSVVRKSFGLSRSRSELVDRLSALERERNFKSQSASGDSGAAGLEDGVSVDVLGESKEDNPSPELLHEVLFASRRSYRLIRHCMLQERVFSDRDLIWTHLPPIFLQQQFIATPCDDYATKSPSLITFTPLREVLVFVLIDAGSVQDNRPPHWVTAQGYRRAIASCVARLPRPASVGHVLHEYHFLAWGKLFAAGSSVVLGSPESSGSGGLHYGVFVVDPSSINLMADCVLDIIDQVCSGVDQSDVGAQWINGGDGLCYFNTDDDRAMFGISGRSSTGAVHWSDEVALTALNSKGSIDVKDQASKRAYLLCYSVDPLPGLFSRTRVVTVTPYYCIINCMDEPVEVRQQFSSTAGEVLCLAPFHSAAWHKTDYKVGTKIHLRAQSSQWSYGCVDINEVGSSVLLLPSKDWFHASANHDAVIAHVEVKLAEPSDNCAVCVVIWRASRERGSMVSVKNDSDLPITIHQAGLFGSDATTPGTSVVNSMPAMKSAGGSTLKRSGSSRDVTGAAGGCADSSSFLVCVAPGVWQPFGWADPEAPPVVVVTIGTPPHGPVRICTTLGLLRLNEVTKLITSEVEEPRSRTERRFRKFAASSNDGDKQTTPNCVYIAVQALGSGRVVRIVRTEEELTTAVRISTDDDHLGLSNGPISKTATGAIVGGVVVGSLILGPIAGALLAGAGIYAVGRSVQKSRAKRKAAGRRKLLMLEARKQSESLGADAPQNGVDENPEAKNMNSKSKAEVRDEGNSEAEKTTGNADDLTMLTADYSAALCFRFAAISFSLTVEKPIRRELLSLFVEKIEGSMKVTATARSFELSIGDIQLDTYSETALHPVILHTLRDEESKDAPLLQFVVVEEAHPETATQHFKYIAVRLLELSVTLDSATLQLVFTDLGADFSLVSREQALAINAPWRWVDEYNGLVLASERRVQLADIFRSQSTARAEKVYIENLVLHPIKVTLSFTQTTLPRGKKEAAVAIAVSMLNSIPAFATVDSVALKLNSFIVADVMESSESLVRRVSAQAFRDLQYQLARLAGSLTMLGRPVGLARNVGGGVQAFFYEPYQGAMKSPSQLVIGVGKGTGALFGGFVTGALNSTASIVSTATAGISQGACYINSDDSFAQRRADVRMRAQQAAKEGIMSGLIEGGYSATLGFASGIGGVFSTPLDYATRDGPVGLVTGLGMGLVGVPVRAVLGLTDALNSVAQTVMVYTSDRRRRALLRPCRAYECLLELPRISRDDESDSLPAQQSTNRDSCVDNATAEAGAPEEQAVSPLVSPQGSSQDEYTTDGQSRGPSFSTFDSGPTTSASAASSTAAAAAATALSFAASATVGMRSQLNSINNLARSQAQPQSQPSWLQANMQYLVLVPLDLAAAYAQAYIVAYARRRGVQDGFLGYALLARDPKKVGSDGGTVYLGDAVFVTLRGVLWRRFVTEGRMELLMDAPRPVNPENLTAAAATSVSAVSAAEIAAASAIGSAAGAAALDADRKGAYVDDDDGSGDVRIASQHAGDLQQSSLQQQEQVLPPVLHISDETENDYREDRSEATLPTTVGGGGRGQVVSDSNAGGAKAQRFDGDGQTESGQVQASGGALPKAGASGGGGANSAPASASATSGSAGASSTTNNKAKRREEVRFFTWAEISHARLSERPRHSVELMTASDIVPIRCLNRARMVALYALLLKHAPRMRNPDYLLPMAAALQELDAAEGSDATGSSGAGLGSSGELSSASSARLGGGSSSGLYGVDLYRFGSSNYCYNYYRTAPLERDAGISPDAAVVSKASADLGELVASMVDAFSRQQRLGGGLLVGQHQHQNQHHGESALAAGSSGGGGEVDAGAGSSASANAGFGAGRGNQTSQETSPLIETDPSLKWRTVDEIMFRLVSDWHSLSLATGSGRGRGSRCVCCALINGSRFPVQVLRTELVYGKALHVLSGFGYSQQARTLLPGGCVVLFVAADKPSLFGSGHAKASISTAACTLTLSTRRVTVDTIANPDGILVLGPLDSEVKLLGSQGGGASGINNFGERGAGAGVGTGTAGVGPGGWARRRYVGDDRVRVLEKTNGESWIKTVVFIQKVPFEV